MKIVSGVWKPTSDVSQKKLAGPAEITNLSLKAGAGAAFVSFYDGDKPEDVTEANLRWVLDASTQDSDGEKFSGLIFRKGVYAVCEQGINLNPIVCFARNNYTS